MSFYTNTSINLSSAFPDYLTWLYPSSITSNLILSIIISIIFFFGVIFIFLYLLRLKKFSTTRYTFLELQPIEKTLKSPLATDELYTLLHSLNKESSLLNRLIGIKRTNSLELISTKHQGIRYQLRVSEDEVSAVKKLLMAYLPGIEIKEVKDPLLSLHNSQSYKLKELTLKYPYIFPLQNQSALNQYDPIAYLTGHMTKLQDNEVIAFQVITNPVYDYSNSQVTGNNNRIRNALLNNEDIKHKLFSSLPVYISSILDAFLKMFLVVLLLPFTLIDWFLDRDNHTPMLAWWVFGGTRTKRLSEIGPLKKDLYLKIQNKIDQPLFEVTVRFIVYTKNYTERLSGLTSSFDTFATPFQSFVVKDSPLVIFQNNLFKDIFNFLLINRLSILSRKSILSVSELSALYHFPFATTTQTEDLVKNKSPQLPPPLSFKQTATNLDITFAKNTYAHVVTPLGQTLEERRRHTYMIGATGTGKTTLLLHMIYEDLKNGKGLAVIDPHGDLSKRLLEIIPKDRIKDVVYFNPYDIEYPIGLNFLEIPKDVTPVEKEREKDFITSSLVSVFHKLYEARYSGPRMEHILRNVILTALEQEKPTLFTIYELLTNTKYRKQVTNNLDDEVLKTFWKNEFDASGSYQRAEQISPITNKLGRFLTTTITRNILNQPVSKLDFNSIMDCGKILLCDLSKGKIGEDTSYFLGSLIIAKLELAAFRRINLPQDKRNDFFLYVDEFQNFATTTFAQVLSEARKYRLCAILAHQNTVQLETDLLDTIIGNSGTIISFRTGSPKDEHKILPLFKPQVEDGQIGNLPSYHFYIKIHALNPQDAFTGQVDDFTIPGDPMILKQVIEHSRSTYSTRIELKKTKPSQNKPFKKRNPNENRFEKPKA